MGSELGARDSVSSFLEMEYRVGGGHGVDPPKQKLISLQLNSSGARNACTHNPEICFFHYLC